MLVVVSTVTTQHESLWLKSVGRTRLETVCSLPVLPVYMAPPTLQRIMNVHVKITGDCKLQIAVFLSMLAL